jgi:hypothetical protein
MESRVIYCCALLLSTAAFASVPKSAQGQATIAPESRPAEASSQSKPRDERPAASSTAIASWIADLDSSEYRVRERATVRLVGSGATALDPLLAAANGNRPEPSERAVWILQKLAHADDPSAAMAALHRLIQLRDHPAIVAQADAELTRINVVAVKRHLESRGAECTVQFETITTTLEHASVFHVRLGEKWRGTDEDFRPLAELRRQRHIRLEGDVINDRVIKHFESSQDLTWMQLLKTKVSVDGVNSLKEKRPNVEIYLKNRALMGVGCADNAAGAIVISVQPGTAAEAAGILKDDIITKINGNVIPDFDRLTANVAQHEPGEQISIELLRGEQTLTVTVTLGSWENFQPR